MMRSHHQRNDIRGVKRLQKNIEINSETLNEILEGESTGEVADKHVPRSVRVLLSPPSLVSSLFNLLLASARRDRCPFALLVLDKDQSRPLLHRHRTSR